MWTRLAVIGAVLLYATGTVAAGVPVDPDDGVGTASNDKVPEVDGPPHCEAEAGYTWERFYILYPEPYASGECQI